MEKSFYKKMWLAAGLACAFMSIIYIFGTTEEQPSLIRIVLVFLIMPVAIGFIEIYFATEDKRQRRRIDRENKRFHKERVREARTWLPVVHELVRTSDRPITISRLQRELRVSRAMAELVYAEYRKDEEGMP